MLGGYTLQILFALCLIHISIQYEGWPMPQYNTLLNGFAQDIKLGSVSLRLVNTSREPNQPIGQFPKLVVSGSPSFFKGWSGEYVGIFTGGIYPFHEKWTNSGRNFWFGPPIFSYDNRYLVAVNCWKGLASPTTEGSINVFDADTGVQTDAYLINIARENFGENIIQSPKSRHMYVLYETWDGDKWSSLHFLRLMAFNLTEDGKLRSLWNVTLGNNTQLDLFHDAQSVAVDAEGTIFVTTPACALGSKAMFRVDMRGRILGSTRAPNNECFDTSPVIGPALGNVYAMFHAADGGAHLAALDPVSLKLLWEQEVTPPPEEGMIPSGLVSAGISPATGNEVVIATGNTINAHDGETGKLLWTWPKTGSNFSASFGASSPIITGDGIVFAVGYVLSNNLKNVTILALDLDSGQLLNYYVTTSVENYNANYANFVIDELNYLWLGLQTDQYGDLYQFKI